MQLVIESGDSGPAVIPGDPDGSNLIRSLRGQGVQKMPPAGELSDAQIDLIVQWIAGGATDEVTVGEDEQTAIDPADLSWAANVRPILEASCGACHGSAGGWDAATYGSTVGTGNSGPAVIPGDAGSSPLAQRLLGNGALMPPGSSLPEDQIELILNWINAGAAP